MSAVPSTCTVICTSCYENVSFLTLFDESRTDSVAVWGVTFCLYVHNVMLSNVRICHDSWYVFATHFVQNMIENWP